MRARIVKIGNSQGVRLPKVLLEQVGITDEIDISIRRNTLVIQPVGTPREGWDAAFEQMALQGDDHGEEVLDPLDQQFDQEEWEWT